MKSTIFWDITPCSPSNVNRLSGGAYRLHFQGWRISRARNQRESKWQAEFFASCSAYSSTLKMEAICSTETSIDIRRTTRRYIPEDSTLHNHRCENLKSWLCLPPACSLVCWTILLPWRWRRYVSPKHRVQLDGLHGVISQKMILFITTAVKTSNP
jgi:hypothetical protein